MATTTVDPYKAYSEAYAQRTKAIEAQTKQAELERTQREQAAQQTLANANRGVYTTYKNAINPYGSFASQNNFSSGVSDYYKNASYGTMLQGIGTNQYNYNDAMNNSNTLWQSYLTEKAGNEADALNDYNSAVIAQQKYDKEQEDLEKERQEAIRQYNLNLQLQQQEAARKAAADAEAKRQWEAEQAENKRRYDQEWAAQQALASSSSGSSGGGSSRSSGGSSGTGLEEQGYTGWKEENGYAVEYYNGQKTGKKIKSNTTAGVVNNTTKGSSKTTSTKKTTTKKKTTTSPTIYKSSTMVTGKYF